jgi:TetR/AcrR family transcriptional repressor of bet genes
MPRVNVKDKRKQQLIDANLVSIAKRGLADTTITHVSEGANMSRGIVNFYFDSKEKMMKETLAHLVDEFNACWQEALTVAVNQSAMGKLETVMRALMADKQCSIRRLAAMTAFIGHAGTHAGYAKLIKVSDELFIKQMRTLFQQAGVEAKNTELRSKQMLAFIRGHHVVAFLNADWGKPSVFADMWVDVLKFWTGAQSAIAAEAPVQSKPIPQTFTKPKKVNNATSLPGQLDFADLFAKT